MQLASESGNGLGYTGKTLTVGRFIIHERIQEIAYARNGNAHNPTAYKVWDIFEDGKRILSCGTLREAKKAAKELA